MALEYFFGLRNKITVSPRGTTSSLSPAFYTKGVPNLTRDDDLIFGRKFDLTHTASLDLLFREK
jgi:hypothetical protein